MRYDDFFVDSLDRIMCFDDFSLNLVKSYIFFFSFSRDFGLYSLQENLDNGSKNRVNIIFVKLRSGCYLYFEDEFVFYLFEINGLLTRLFRDRESRLQRQKFVVESISFILLQFKFFYSLLDSFLIDFMGFFMNRQFSKDIDNSDQWFIADESFRELFDFVCDFKDDLFINF